MPDLICMMKFIQNLISSGSQTGCNKKPVLILHIGTEKTGTTTIQEFLHLNRNLLADNGIYFPKSIGIRNHRPLASWCLPDHRDDVYLRMNNLTGSHERKAWKNAFIEKFDEELNCLRPQIKQVIISSEHFSSLLGQPFEVETLKRILDKWFSNIKVIVYLRRQDLLALSLFNTLLKAGLRQKRIFVGFSPQYKYFGYKFLMDKWSLVFGKGSIHPGIFEKGEWKNNDLLIDFRNICQIPEGLNYKLPENKNQSYSETTHEVAMLFNNMVKHDLTGNDLKTLSKIRNEILENINKKYHGMGKIPLRKEAIDYYEIFKESNNIVAQEWFGREKLFNEDFSMYSETYPADRQIPDYEQILNEEINDKMEILKPFLVQKTSGIL